MLNSLLQGSLKALAYFVFWVFVLSINWNGRTLFDRSHDILVDNALVADLDSQLKQMWQGVATRLSAAFEDGSIASAPQSETTY